MLVLINKINKKERKVEKKHTYIIKKEKRKERKINGAPVLIQYNGSKYDKRDK